MNMYHCRGFDQDRRRFLRRAGAAGVGLALSGCAGLMRGQPHVAVVGGGFAGAAAARALRLADPGLAVTLLEPKAVYLTCPASNWYLAGLCEWDVLEREYRSLTRDYGVVWRQTAAKGFDFAKRKVLLADGGMLSYDRLIVAPGIEFDYGTLHGYGAELTARFPHAWQAGWQTRLLRRQLEAMPDGGVAVMTVPAEPYRCPPGPYERASLLAYWLQRNKPRSKLLILDAKTGFSKQKLFEEAWRRLYGYGGEHALLEWITLADNPLQALSQSSATLSTAFGDSFSGAVLNIIPPQRAAAIAREAGLTDAGGWCPVKPETGESLLQPGVHVVGDAARYAPIPKSAFAAVSEAKTCARAVAALLRGQEPPEPQWLNVCYSLVNPEYGISVAGAYRAEADKIVAVKGAGGLSGGGADTPRREAVYARGVYRRLLAESFGEPS